MAAAEKRIVLLGIGHTNAEIVRRWGRNPLPGCRLVCLSNFPQATYSGMLPGVLAGQFAPAEMQIDLEPLARRSGAEFRVAEVTELDPLKRELRFADGPSLRFDALSIGIGSTPVAVPQGARLRPVIEADESEEWSQSVAGEAAPPAEGGNRDDPASAVVPIKPMQTFVRRLEQRLQPHAEWAGGRPRVVIVGGGVAGVELACCLWGRFNVGPAEFRAGLGNVPDSPPSLEIVTAGDEIMPGVSAACRRRASRLLEVRRIAVRTGQRVTRIEPHRLATEVGAAIPADVVIWATGAAAPSLLARLNLPVDRRGFLATRPTLQVVGHDSIFAVGDCGTILEKPVAKAGVHAVYQGPVLWRNLRKFLSGEPLEAYRGKDRFLKLINTGDGRALLDYPPWASQARWCWWLKRWIDKRFVARYQGDADSTSAPQQRS